jgi:hypothetical protein
VSARTPLGFTLDVGRVDNFSAVSTTLDRMAVALDRTAERLSYMMEQGGR